MVWILQHCPISLVIQHVGHFLVIILRIIRRIIYVDNFDFFYSDIII